MLAFEITHNDIAAAIGALAILGSAAISGVFLYAIAKLKQAQNGTAELAKRVKALEDEEDQEGGETE